MQQMTPAICAAATTPNVNATTYTTTHTTDKTKVPQTTLTDTRDNRTYTVRKLADGHCWMVNDFKYQPTEINGSTYWYSYGAVQSLKPGSFRVPERTEVETIAALYTTAAQTTGFPQNYSTSGGYRIIKPNLSIGMPTAAYYWKNSDDGTGNPGHNDPTFCYTVNYYSATPNTIGHASRSCGCTVSTGQVCYFMARYLV